MIDLSRNTGELRRRLVAVVDVGRRRYLWTTAAAVLGLVALTATAGLVQAGRLPSTFLRSGVSSGAGASDHTVDGAGSASSTVSSSDVLSEVSSDVLSALASAASSTDGGSPAPPPAPAGPPSTGTSDTDTGDTDTGDTDTDDTDTDHTVLPPGASRLVPVPPNRVVDTRNGPDTDPPDTPVAFTLDGDPVAVMVSVTVMNATQAGSVLVDGGDGVVEAVRLPKPGATTTNLVVVPVAGDEVNVSSSAGGHLVVDLVGRFEAVAGPVTAGRFVAINPEQVATLETAVDGRELDVTLDAEELSARLLADLSAASAVLAVVTADVGTDGGMVRLGPAPDDFDQMLMWAPALDDNRLRRGLVLLDPTDDRLTSLRYEGGTELTVEVIGYFTGESARPDDAGLFVPTGPHTIHDGLLSAGTPSTAPGVRTDSATALITVGPRSGIPGQLGSAVVAAERGRVAIGASSDVEAVVVLLGEFRS